MKKRGMSIKINLSNRWLYTFIALGILATVLVGTYALTPGVKPNPGHLLNEIVPVTGCIAGQMLVWNGSIITCTNNFDSGVKFAGAAAKPSCTANTRGTMWFNQSVLGTSDDYSLCMKSKDNGYCWINATCLANTKCIWGC
jgi:hypothetical protein